MPDHTSTFLIEILCEEIPANAFPDAVTALRSGVVAILDQHRIEHAEPLAFATPRRLAVLVPRMAAAEPSRVDRVTGPPKKAAFDAAGEPTPAARGFARAHGVPVEALSIFTTPKGDVIGLEKRIEGQSAADLLASKLPAFIGGMSFPKTMRWGDGTPRFVRAVRNLVAVVNGEPIPMSLFGMTATRDTRGHRFIAPGPIPMDDPAAYAERLRSGGVVADPAERRAIIEGQLQGRSLEAGGALVPDPGLLEQLVHLTEHPFIILGRFDEAFLALPREVLITALRDHQKCFTVQDAAGKLLPWFLAVSDVQGDAEGFIRRGNEWVLNGRLRDAEFFWKEDRKTPLHARHDRLGKVVFMERVGTYLEKTRRLEVFVRDIASAAGLAAETADHAALAARLSKCDLVSSMVGEFASLQGIMGGIYAEREGLPEPVWQAVYDQYLPRNLEERTPRGTAGALLGIADRMDTIVSAFLVGAEPTGTRDPHGLRRAAQGLVRILLEHRLDAGLGCLTDRCVDLLRDKVPEPPADARAKILQYVLGRIRFVLESAGFRSDAVNAAAETGFDRVPDLAARVEALTRMQGEEAFAAICAAHKRISNILKGREKTPFGEALLSEEAEIALHRKYLEVVPEVERNRAAGDYVGSLSAIAAMRGSVDAFFDSVLVMAEDPGVRANRLALLGMIAAMFSLVADFSQISAEAAP